MKNWINKNQKLIFPFGLIIFLTIGGLYAYFILFNTPKVTDFDSCIKVTISGVNGSRAGRCTYDGITYTRNIGLEGQDPNRGGINLDLPENEKSQIEAWLEKNNYNQYGDSIDTMYTGGTPLFDEATGSYVKLYDYLIKKYPNKPWLENTSNITENSNTNPAVKSFAEVKSWQNFEDPNFELQYPDFVNMANENGYPVKFSTNDGFEFIIEITDKQPNYSAGTCEKKLDIDGKSLYLCYNKNITYQEIYQRMLDLFVIR